MFRMNNPTARLPAHLVGDRATLESYCRQQCQTTYLGNNTALCRVLGKHLMFVNTTDVGITPHLCMDGYWESWITLAMARVLRPGAYCVDVGANQGYYTLLMADGAGPDGRVLAVEPVPSAAELLSHTIGVNGYSEYTQVSRKPLADAVDKRVTLIVPQNRSLNATISRSASDGDGTVELVSTTLDRLTHDWPRIDLVKIDVEGAEQMVWRGMQTTVDKHRDITIIMEVNCARYEDAAGFFSQIEQSGFSLRFIDFDSIVKSVNCEELLRDRLREDVMLFLHRS